MPTHLLHPVTLVANEQLKPRLHRLTFTAEAFADYPLSGPDEYFGLLMPQPGQSFRPFELTGINIRAAVATMPEATRPDLRWYTIRSLDRAQKRIDVDVVTHGDSGPGSRWIRRARPGDTAGMFTCPALWTPPTTSQLLLADASALPAMRHILDYQQANAPEALAQTHVVAVVTDPAEVEDGLAEQWGEKLASFTFVEAPKTAETEATLAALHALFDTAAGDKPRSVWVSGEGNLTKAVRALAVKEWGLDPADVTWVPFWFHGKARP
ncbi:siderophore-interacting protein [Corynebacterium timonense]|uniref:NADPH-dependent ferric siderophore reductase, contains FAD-binding and SIP domains n=1 Tax=Corynebacterium timonense TaxID=441500 RepID=A0A1H1SQK1_9CORY|nr:siderophore-interacting protein [Corynebacterium timonense]SDS50143.1 NADPH-dependent ferric siderophore reductase, contains FAD-binding and SIP domains [Corynebacterium timonense]